MINLRKIGDGATQETCVDRSPRNIEAASDQIRVAVEGAENPRAITPLACMTGSDLFRIFLELHASHGDVMEIA
jgi:hypothetical protein